MCVHTVVAYASALTLVPLPPPPLHAARTIGITSEIATNRTRKRRMDELLPFELSPAEATRVLQVDLEPHAGGAVPADPPAVGELLEQVHTPPRLGERLRVHGQVEARSRVGDLDPNESAA